MIADIKQTALTLAALMHWEKTKETGHIRSWQREDREGCETHFPPFVLKQGSAHETLQGQADLQTIDTLTQTLQHQLKTLLDTLASAPVATHLQIQPMAAVNFTMGKTPRLAFSFFFTHKDDVEDPNWRNLSMKGQAFTWDFCLNEEFDSLQKRLDAILSFDPDRLKNGDIWRIEKPIGAGMANGTSWNAKQPEDALRAHMLLLEPWMTRIQDISNKGIHFHRIPSPEQRTTIWKKARKHL